MSQQDQSSSGAPAARIEALVTELEALSDEHAKAKAQELVGAVLDLHREGLARALELLSTSGEPGRALVEALARDGLVASLLVLHDLHPHPLEERVRSAIDTIRAHLGVQGATVELVEVQGGVARVRVERRAGHAATAQSLREAIEDAIREKAPDAAGVEIVGRIEPGRGEASLVQIHFGKTAGATP